MMKKLMLLCGLVLACSFTAKAQEDYSKLDIFGGFSYVRFQFPNAGFNGEGGSGQITYNATPIIGITGDFGGYHVAAGNNNGSGTVFTYLFGPKLTLRRGNWAPFIQTLFGGAWLGAGISEVCDDARVSSQQSGGCGGVSTSFNSFSMALGGGVDYKFSDRLSYRVFDVDYLMTRFNAQQIGGVNNTQSNVRFSTGVVFHF
jgi:opacity protein-like surface antigen